MTQRSVTLLPHVTGEVRDGHAALAGLLVAAAGDDLGVAQHEGAVVRAGLGVLGHVDAEHLHAHADLGRGQPDAARGDAHRGHEVGGELHHLRVGRVDLRTDLGQDGGGRTDHVEHTTLDGQVVLGPAADGVVDEGGAHSSSLSTSRSDTPTPSEAPANPGP